MALSPAAKRLKDMKKGKKSDDAPKDEDDAPMTDDAPKGGETLSDDDMLASLEKAASDDDKGEETEEVEMTEEVEVGGAPAGDAPDGAEADPVKVFSDVLELDELTAQAVYGEAMSMPELGDMSPEQMAKKIKGNYDMLKKIIVSMGEKAAMAMKDDLNQPPAPAGPDMGGPPMGEPAAGGMAPL